MENAIANHQFEQARAHSEEQEKIRKQLRDLEERTPPSNILTPRDIAEAAAALVGAPLAVVENVMRQPDASRVEQIARELVALIPQGREWLEPLAAYLAGCTEEEAKSLATRIRAGGRETPQI
jgi:hypothetical protein